MDSLTGSAIQEINKLNKAATKREWISNQSGGAMMLGETGLELMSVDPHEHCYAKTIQGFGDMAINLWERRGSPDESVITICEQGLMFKTHPTSQIHNSHRCEMNLVITQQFKLLVDIQARSGLSFSQKELNRWLRKHFHDSHMNTECMPTMRELKFKHNAESVHSTQHATDEMSNSAKRQAMGANGSALPEFGTLSVQVWSEAPDITAEIQCAIDIDMDEQKIEICPLAGEIDKAIQEAVESVDSQITSIIGSRDITIITDATLGHKTVM
jgi:hypothetical protein